MRLAPKSLSNIFGAEYRKQISSTRILAMVLACVFCNANPSTYRVLYSVNVSIYLLPLGVRTILIMSMAQRSPIKVGGNGCSSAFVGRTGCFRVLHFSQDNTQALVSTYIPLQKYFRRRVEYVRCVPK